MEESKYYIVIDRFESTVVWLVPRHQIPFDDMEHEFLEVIKIDFKEKKVSLLNEILSDDFWKEIGHDGIDLQTLPDFMFAKLSEEDRSLLEKIMKSQGDEQALLVKERCPEKPNIKRMLNAIGQYNENFFISV